MKVLIFGINGQDGHYLRNICTRNSIEVIGVSRSQGDWIKGSVADLELVTELVKKHKPDYIFHLAANSTTHHSALFENNETISIGTINILEAVYRNSPFSKVFLSGSALQFENVGKPISELDNWSASSSYSVARIHSVYLGRYYRNLGIDVYVGYFFNHDSPLRSERHMSQKIAQAVKRISKGSNEILEIGNMKIKKEYTFAGDIAEAIWLLVNNKFNIYECVIGSGKAYSIEDWLNLCCEKYNIEPTRIVSSLEMFVPEYNILVSDPRLLLSLGWKQTIEIDELAALMSK